MFAFYPSHSFTSNRASFNDPFAPAYNPNIMGGCRYDRGSCYYPNAYNIPAIPYRVPARRPAPRQVDSEENVRIVRDSEGVRVLIHLRGFPKNNIKIDVHETTLDVSAAASPSILYPYGATFQQSFDLGPKIDADRCAATFEQNVLIIRLPYKVPNSTGLRRIIVQSPVKDASKSSPRPPTPHKETGASGPPQTETKQQTEQQRAPPSERQPKEEVKQMKQKKQYKAEKKGKPHSSRVKPTVTTPPPQPEENTTPSRHTADVIPPSSGLKFEKIVEYIGEQGEDSSKQMSPEEKAAAWLASHHNGSDGEEAVSSSNDEEDGSIEDCTFY